MFHISILGSGNVATQLSLRLFEKGHHIQQVFSRNIKNAKQLAEQVQARPIQHLNELTNDADIYILAIKDDAIEEVASLFPFNNRLVVHTSGATPSTVFQSHFQRFGVFYPLQTFSKNKKADFETLPICIDANEEADLLFLEKLGRSICPNIYKIDDEERAILHVCAVLVNNFTNHLYALAADILEKEDIEMNILKPLIQETVDKIKNHSPKSMQTGPARRNDQLTLQKHTDYLSSFPEVEQLYQSLSESIIKMYHKNIHTKGGKKASF